MPVTKFRDYARTQTDHFVMGLVGTSLLVASILSNSSLREFSSVVAVVCLMGLLWRIIGGLPKMTTLSVMLAASLCVNLAASALAQYLLSRQINHLPQDNPTPDNVLGLMLVLAARLFILFVIVTWPRWLDYARYGE